MDTFKLWILSVCGASTIASLCRILLSKSKVKKTTNIFFSLFILLYMLIPFVNLDYSLSKDFDYNNEIIYDVDYKNGYEKFVIKSIETICMENGIDIISVDIDSYIDEDGNLLVNSVFLNISDKSRVKETEIIIKNNLGFEVTVN